MLEGYVSASERRQLGPVPVWVGCHHNNVAHHVQVSATRALRKSRIVTADVVVTLDSDLVSLANAQRLSAQRRHVQAVWYLDEVPELVASVRCRVLVRPVPWLRSADRLVIDDERNVDPASMHVSIEPRVASVSNVA